MGLVAGVSDQAVQELRVAMTALAENPHVSEADFAAVCDAHLAVSQALFAQVDVLNAALHDLLRNIGGHNHWREGGAGGVCRVCEVQSAAVSRAYAALSSLPSSPLPPVPEQERNNE